MSKRKLYFGLLILSTLFFLNIVGVWNNGKFDIKKAWAAGACGTCAAPGNCHDLPTNLFFCFDGSTVPYCTMTIPELQNNGWCGSPTPAPTPPPPTNTPTAGPGCQNVSCLQFNGVDPCVPCTAGPTPTLTPTVPCSFSFVIGVPCNTDFTHPLFTAWSACHLAAAKLADAAAAVEAGQICDQNYCLALQAGYAQNCPISTFTPLATEGTPTLQSTATAPIPATVTPVITATTTPCSPQEMALIKAVRKVCNDNFKKRAEKNLDAESDCEDTATASCIGGCALLETDCYEACTNKEFAVCYAIYLAGEAASQLDRRLCLLSNPLCN